MQKLVLAAILFAATSSYAYDVHCWGHNTRTGATVDGRCRYGHFSGYQWDTRDWVTGSCSNGGFLSAYNNYTGDWVSGSCDRAFPAEEEADWTPAE